MLSVSLCVFVFSHFCIDVPLQRLLFVRGYGAADGMGRSVDAWLHADCVGARGQGLVLDEPERHLAGECQRDEWAVRFVSACCPFSLRVCVLCIDVPLQRWVFVRG
eukprot:COSAG02_NODE_28776_length_581_cov_2.028986_1_plen_105_part_01